MFYVHVGRAIAFIGFWGSLLQIGMALLLIFGLVEVAISPQNPFSANNTGNMLNTAIWGLLISLCLGILSEIGARLIALSNNVGDYLSEE